MSSSQLTGVGLNSPCAHVAGLARGTWHGSRWSIALASSYDTSGAGWQHRRSHGGALGGELRIGGGGSLLFG
jgi:hypothetical protein